MKLIYLFPCAAILLAFAACTDKKKEAVATTSITSSFSLDSVKAQITASNAKFGGCFANGDSTGFISCYTSDACINPSNMPRMCGAAAITAFFNGGSKMGIHNLKLTTEEVMGGQDAVAETGKYEMQDAKGNVMDKGKYIVVWKEENGKWKMHRDEWNSDMPLTATK